MKIASHLTLPPAVVGQTQAILAMKGAGKTYAAMKMFERMAQASFQAVALDPTGVWWGLTTSADGRGPGVPVIVMGGEHGHVPLEPTAGEYVAEFIVDSGKSVVLDLSLMRKGEMHRFTAAFLERLYHYKAKHKSSLHVFFDEADTAAPQQPGPEQARVLGAAEDCVRRGRSRGLGMTLITQRPAVLNKNLLEMADTLYVMRVIGANDQEAIRKRLQVDADTARVSEVIGTLARLEQGEAYVFSPQALKMFARVKFDARDTFDTSRSPEPGKPVPSPKYRAEVDLDQLSAQIKATVERAKGNDPAELRKKIVALEKQLASAPVETKTVEKPVVSDAQVKRVETIVDRLEREGQRRIEAGHALAKSGEELKTTAADFAAALRKAAMPPRIEAPTAIPNRIAPRIERQASIERRESTEEGAISKRQQRMLDAAATLTTLNTTVSRETVAAWIGVHPRGGSLGEDLKALADGGFIEIDRGTITVTETGMTVATIGDPAEAVRQAKAGLSNRQKTIFEIAERAYPGSTSRESVAAEMNIHPRGGSLGEDIKRLVDRGLITSDRGVLRVRDFLFAS